MILATVDSRFTLGTHRGWFRKQTI